MCNFFRYYHESHAIFLWIIFSGVRYKCVKLIMEEEYVFEKYSGQKNFIEKYRRNFECNLAFEEVKKFFHPMLISLKITQKITSVKFFTSEMTTTVMQKLQVAKFVIRLISYLIEFNIRDEIHLVNLLLHV